MNEQLDRIELKLAEVQQIAEETRTAAEKTRRYILWSAVVTLAFIIVPLIILPFVIPAFLASVALPVGF